MHSVNLQYTDDQPVATRVREESEGRTRINTYLLQQPPLLNNVWDCLHLYTFCLIDVFQSVELSRLLVLHHSDLHNLSLGSGTRGIGSGTHLSESPFTYTS